MAIMIRDKIIENSQKFLQPGETVSVVIGGQRISGWWGALSFLWVLWNRYEAVIVTPHRILVLDCGKWTMGTPRSVLRELPRATRDAHRPGKRSVVEVHDPRSEDLRPQAVPQGRRARRRDAGPCDAGGSPGTPSTAGPARLRHTHHEQRHHSRAYRVWCRWYRRGLVYEEE